MLVAPDDTRVVGIGEQIEAVSGRSMFQEEIAAADRLDGVGGPESQPRIPRLLAVLVARDHTVSWCVRHRGDVKSEKAGPSTRSLRRPRKDDTP